MQVAHATVDAALVREVRETTGLAQHWCLEFDADEPPRSAGDVGKIVGAAWHGNDSGCRVVRPGSAHADPWAGSQFRRNGW